MKTLHRRIIDLSYEQGLSHIGSCLTSVDIIEDIYKKMALDSLQGVSNDFVLSCGHAHLAHLVVREQYRGYRIGKIHDIHCNRKDGCTVPTGSLGQGVCVAVGMALADRSKKIYCLISDGELAEGSCWEALRTADELELENLIVYVNANGYAAYQKTNRDLLEAKLQLFNPRVKFVRTRLPDWPFIKDPQEYHYKVLSKEEYESII